MRMAASVQDHIRPAVEAGSLEAVGPKARPLYPLIDRVVRRGRRFCLIEEPAQPNEAAREIRYARRRVLEWLREMPEQIERAVVRGVIDR